MSSITVSLPPYYQEALVKWMRQFPDITEEEALADLWSQGVHCKETGDAFRRREIEAENRRHNVFDHPDWFRGYHVAAATKWKEGVLRFEATRQISVGWEMIIGFCSPDVLRVAIEQKICSKPNGFMLP